MRLDNPPSELLWSELPTTAPLLARARGSRNRTSNADRIVEEPTPREGPTSHSSSRDLGLLMSKALQHPLLPAARERSFAKAIWDARKRLAEELRSEPATLELDLDSPLTLDVRNFLLEAELRARALLSGRKLAHRRGRNVDVGKVRATCIDALKGPLHTIAHSRELLLMHNLRLVLWAASSYRGRGLDFADLVQEGALGLLYAIDRFDPAAGARLGTFATVVIRNHIRRALTEKARLIRAPIRRIREIGELETARAELASTLGRRPTVKEIATATGSEESSVSSLLAASAAPLSLETTVVSEGIALENVLADENVVSPFAVAAERERSHTVSRLLGRLEHRAATILSMRFGFDGGGECTLEEIGQRLGLSRERIRQLEKEALASLKEIILNETPELPST